MNTEDTKQEELQNVTPSGKPAPRRLASARGAYNVFKTLKDEDERGEATPARR